MISHAGGMMVILLIIFNLLNLGSATHFFVVEFGPDVSIWPGAALYYTVMFFAIVAALIISLLEVAVWMLLIECLEKPLTRVRLFRHQSHEEIFFYATLLAPLNFFLLSIPIKGTAAWMEFDINRELAMFTSLPLVILLGILEIGGLLWLWRMIQLFIRQQQ